VHSHRDLAALSPDQRKRLCEQIRQFLVSNVSQTGGHLASNLGVVELTVAIETVFDTNIDRLVFDVGHQSYVHKLLTGRQADFSSLRQYGGIAGFPKPSESPTDAFVAGHASSSVSIALGMARARTLQQQSYHVIALLGDGAATGGMSYEGLNDAADCGEPLIVILNDNEMSIDHNVGGISRHLSRLRTKPRYLLLKKAYRRFLDRIPGGKWIYRVTRNGKNRVKRLILRSTIFENMGLRYLGPVDGHDVEELIDLFRLAKQMQEPVLIHVQTHKGHGYRFAEEKPAKFHGIGKFDPVSGKSASKKTGSFSDVFGGTLTELASADERICAITAAMPGGTGLLGFKDQFSNRFFDVGIAEEHAVSMAAGLAKQGMVPVVALYSTFLQRSFDQLLQDVALLQLHVVLAVDRCGLVGEDGETHHGVFDSGYLRLIPGMTVLCPGSCAELSQMLTWATLKHDGPVALRYPRGTEGAYRDSHWDANCTSGFVCHRDGADCTLITYGTMINPVLEAAEKLQNQGISACVLRLLRWNGFDECALMQQLTGNVFVVEETMKQAALSPEISEMIRKHKEDTSVFGLNLGDTFVTHGSLADLRRERGLDCDGIVRQVMEARERHG